MTNTRLDKGNQLRYDINHSTQENISIKKLIREVEFDKRLETNNGCVRVTINDCSCYIDQKRLLDLLSKESKIVTEKIVTMKKEFDKL